MREGTRQVDESLQVWVIIDEADEAALKQLVASFGETLGQESMYLERTTSVVDFIPPSSGGNDS